MESLENRIRLEGKVLPGNMIKVDSFLNHQIDPAFLGEMAAEFARRFDMTGVTRLLTVESSGIALGTVCACKYGLPLVFVKKARSPEIEGNMYKSNIFSLTYHQPATLVCSADYLGSEDKVLIIDDFLANGQNVRGLIDIVRQAGAELAGIGVAVEKGFLGGGDKLRQEGYDVQSLAIIDRADDQGFEFRK